MIKVQFEHRKDINTIVMKVEGHAGQATKGNDVICSAASILVYTVAQYLNFIYKRGGLQKKPRILLNDGDALIVAKPKSEFEGEVLNTFFVAEVGYSLLAHNYPQYVKLKMFGEA
jgi:uncharacterized protein YsxB (DUF464 family)